MDFSKIDPDKLSENFSSVIGFTSFQPSVAPIIDQVVPDSVGYYAGLSVGDEILAINDVEIYSWAELVQQIRNNPGQLLELDILRNEQIITLSITPEAAQEKGKQIGKIGIAPRIDRAEFDKILVKVSYPPIQALFKAFEKTWETTQLTFRMLGKMVTGDVSWKNISGPISIADYAGQSAQMGLVSYLAFLALISISIAVLNLLPIPVLDGGHLMYYLIEIVRGTPLSDKMMLLGQKIGLTLLLTLMVFAIYNDINRLITG